jgi:Leucine-rich repeat (LRR) protein
MPIYNILVFTLIVIQEVTRAAVCPEPCTCLQGAAQSHEDITVICKRAALTELPDHFNIQTRELDASFNNITALKNNTLARNCLLVKTLSLNFSHNIITSIELLAFSGLTHLHKLDLSNNKLTTLHRWTFSYTRYLSSLNLSNNKMLVLQANGHFVETPNLRTLDLSSCNLVEMSKNAFCCAPNLEYIRLDRNKFETLHVSVFIKIFADKLSTEECYASTTTLNKLRYLNIAGIPLKCDCQFYKMRKFLETFSIEYELQSSCGSTKYNISDACDYKETNQHNEITSFNSEATTRVVTTNVGENSSGSSVITPTALPSSEEAHLLNILLQPMINIKQEK